MKKEILALCLVILTMSCGIITKEENNETKDLTATVAVDSTKVLNDSLATKLDSIKK